MAVKSRTKPKADKSEPAPQPETAPAIVAFKGFDKDLRCRGFQFEVGKTYAHTGEVKACESGFHACEHPLNVFDYYAPAFSRFAEVELSGDLSRHDGDTKIAAGQITIKAELRIPDLVARAIKWVMDRTHSEEGASATGYQGAASATGPRGAASATGYQGRASGADGCALFLVERDDDWKIVAVWAGVVGRDGIKPDTFYTLRDGNPVEL